MGGHGILSKSSRLLAVLACLPYTVSEARWLFHVLYTLFSCACLFIPFIILAAFLSCVERWS